MKLCQFIICAALCFAFASCEPETLPDGGDGNNTEQTPGDGDENAGDNNEGESGGNDNVQPPSYEVADYDYVFDITAVPEIHVSVSEEQWNTLLGLYDANPDTDEYIHCDASFTKGSDHYAFTDAGLRLRGNTSRRRPEAGDSGSLHNSANPDWQHCHFMINLRKFVKDDAHELRGVRKLHLKWHKDDAAYAREIYCYDLFRRFGIWTALRASYCRLWIKVGNTKEAYYGVYEMLEAVDERYLKARKEGFGNDDYFLWKCGWGADLNSDDPNRFWNDDEAGTENRAYTLKTATDNFAAAEAQIIDFIRKLRGKGDESFAAWIPTVTDVELLLRTYAVNVVVGMWDDYWCNQNNYYIYFNSDDQYDYRFFFIPYDYDNTLGTSNIIDSGRQNPLSWGNSNQMLISRLLKIDAYRKIYVDALKELCGSNDYFAAEGSIARIRMWQDMIKEYIPNDTGEDMELKDVPASWGNHSEYRLFERGSNNFFDVKTSVVNALK
ncbi:MAG: CotH kinase family protein [Alistipes sp.]|nr:CotH kinase family protein [Alistipes sp.]